MAKKAAANVGPASSLSPKSKKNETGKMPVLRSSALVERYQFMLGQTAFNPHRFRGELNLINTSHGPNKRSHASGVKIIVDRLYK